MTSSGGQRLTTWILIAIALAIAISIAIPMLGRAGLVPGTAVYAARTETLEGLFHWIGLGGEIFLRLLKMMVVPLVLFSVMSGILGMGDVRKLGRPGAWTLGLYLSTTVLAVLLGQLLVSTIQPGRSEIDRAQAEALVAERGAELEQKGLEVQEEGVGLVFRKLTLMLFTDNLIASAAHTELLPLILFSVVFAGLLTTLGRRVETLAKFITQANDAVMAFVLLVMRIAPFGIFCLVAGRFGLEMLGGRFVETLKLVAWYSWTVVIGLALHGLVTLPLMVWLFTRRNPYRFLGHMAQALLTAFSTGSSSATLPVTMECAVDRAKVSRKAADLVLPLGATVNMDGTALYEAVAAVFIAQFLGRDLSLTQQAVITLTATLAAIGAASIPEAGLVTMLIVLNAVGLPLKYQALIIPVDWLLDRFRTIVNVFGDACVANVVDRTFPPEEAPPHAGETPDLPVPSAM
jgi:Na+/H+-dicarboxylate symporter